MDSGNSGSIQSSSGGEEELDSRADTISAFMSHPQNHVSSLFKYPVQHPQHQLHHLMMDPQSGYLDHIRRPSSSISNQNSLPNIDMLWSEPLRSDPNRDLGDRMPSSSTAQNTIFKQSQMAWGQTRETGIAAFQDIQHSLLPPESTGAFASGGLVSVSASMDQVHKNSNIHSTVAPDSSTTTNPNNNMVRNPKKRSRASRRAPTTVLTTDTTNFRAMVQEFTGIPAPPFTSTHFPRSRLDLFGTAAASNLRSAHFDPSSSIPPYLLRTFGHKVQPLAHPFVSPSSSSSSSFPFSSPMVVDSLVSNSSSSNTHSTSVNYPLSSDLGLLKQTPENLLNMNMHTSTMFNFQPLVPIPSKFSLTNSPSINLRSKPQGSLDTTPISANADPNLKMRGVFEEFGLSHGHINTNLSGLQNIVNSSSELPLSGSDGMKNASINWDNVRGITNDESDPNLLRSNGSGTFRTSETAINGDKGNYLVSSSDFHGDKGPDCVAGARTEGMVESWIGCSSD